MAIKKLSREVGAKYLLFGVLVPVLIYLVAFDIDPDREIHTRFAKLGLDPYKLHVDTLSPRLAAELGLRTKRPTTEILVVFVSSADCVANKAEGFSDAMSRIRGLIDTQLSGNVNAVSRFVGISVDTDPKTGVEYLFQLADFDEVVAGGNWLNTATEKYFWHPNGYRLTATIPRIVVLQRTTIWDETSARIEQEKMLLTIETSPSIVKWIGEGAPIGS